MVIYKQCPQFPQILSWCVGVDDMVHSIFCGLWIGDLDHVSALHLGISGKKLLLLSVPFFPQNVNNEMDIQRWEGKNKACALAGGKGQKTALNKSSCSYLFLCAALTRVFFSS